MFLNFLALAWWPLETKKNDPPLYTPPPARTPTPSLSYLQLSVPGTYDSISSKQDLARHREAGQGDPGAEAFTWKNGAGKVDEEG